MKKRNLLSLLLLLAAGAFFAPPIRAEVIILTSDQQLNDLMDPEKKIDMSLGYDKRILSLKDVCENGQRNGDRELTVAFDEFFRQYRTQAGTERRLTPDMDEYVQKIKFISDYAKKYGMGLCLSLLSPLELGPAYKNQTGEAGRWLNYKVGFRNPSDGSFSLPIWQQLYWTNNKGKFQIKLKGVKAYAFREKALGNSPLRAVAPEDIIEIQGVKYEAGDTINGATNNHATWIDTSNDVSDMEFPVRSLRVYYDGPEQLAGYDRVMVVLEYESPEMDYFSPKAPEFLKGLMDKYHENGINLTSFYSDEMHIQQDWSYFTHHENGQFAVRYLTPGFSERYERTYGQALDDKYMLYFAYGAPNYLPTAGAVRNVQYVMGETPEAIHATFLLRDRYYKMLNHGVVDLFNDAKKYACGLFGREMATSAHSSWAESPTIDFWDWEQLHENAYKYEYTPNFVWSNTVHQAAAACYDYFKWGEYLQPTGNDFAECGWGDRNYYGAAMGTSIGVINKYPNAYAAAWGMPHRSLEWKSALNDAYGAQASYPMRLMTDNVHRDIEVLVLYPMNLVAVEERFGSWMTQYGYCNYLTADKLTEMGRVTEDGHIRVAEKQYGTLVAMFEPMPQKGLLEMMARFVEKGGKVVWFGMPPLLDSEGNDCTAQWSALFGASYRHNEYLGEMAPGKKIAFSNTLANVPEQLILTDLLVDKIYPVTVSDGAETTAKVENLTVGTKMKHGKGAAYFCGFRPRDDQSASLGYETRTLFEILNAADAYPSSGRFGTNDNPSVIARTTDYFATAFPNGTTAIVKHYRTHRENWEGGFSRNEEADRKAYAANPLPSDRMELRGMKINGHEVTYEGKMNMAFRTGTDRRLCAFNGRECTGVTIDGTEYRFSDTPVDVTFVPAGDNGFRACVKGTGKVSLPLSVQGKKTTVKLGKKNIKHEISGGDIILDTEGISGGWLDITVK